jgi:hypothetical protein
MLSEIEGDATQVRATVALRALREPGVLARRAFAEARASLLAAAAERRRSDLKTP